MYVCIIHLSSPRGLLVSSSDRGSRPGPRPFRVSSAHAAGLQPGLETPVPTEKNTQISLMFSSCVPRNVFIYCICPNNINIIYSL